MKHFNKIKTMGVLLAIGCSALASSAWADRLDELQSRGKLWVGVSDTTPPFSFKAADGTLTGYDLDLVRAVAKRLGVGLEMTALSSAERVPLLQQGKLDFVATY
jgi:ABC-type amino acid transport substrate-binding protein